MRKVVIFTLLGLVAVALLIESGMFEALALFLLAGIIPGTDISIPYGVMLLAFIGIAWLVFFRFVVADIIAKLRRLRRDTQRKKRLPKRRFSQI